MTRDARRLVLLVTEDWYVASHRLPLISAASDAGWDVTVLTRVRAHRDAIERAGAQVVPLSLDRAGVNPLREAATLAEIIGHYRRVQPRVVHHVGIKPIIYGSLAARATGISGTVNAFAGLGSLAIEQGEHHSAYSVLQAMVRWSPPRRAIALVQNASDRATIVRAKVTTTDRIRLVPGMGVDLQAYAVQSEPDGRPIVMFVGRLLRQKGVAEFVACAERFASKARFVLVGAPDAANPSAIGQEQLERWCQRGTVEWWGHREDMPHVMAQASLVVLPSYREGMPKALMEAAACGRAIVTTDVPGCRDVVEHGVNGLLVPPRDADALAAAIEELLDNRERREAMGKAGRAKAERQFDDRELARQTVAIYEELLG